MDLKWFEVEEKRKSYVLRVLQEKGFLIRPEYVESVVGGVVKIGMTPFEAKAAGGAFAYKVVPDAGFWKPDEDPLKVLWAQVDSPDKSQITMHFKNASQFSTDVGVSFIVKFELGRVVSIKEE